MPYTTRSQLTMMDVQIVIHSSLVGTSIYHWLFSLSLSLQPHVSISCVDTQCAGADMSFHWRATHRFHSYQCVILHTQIYFIRCRPNPDSCFQANSVNMRGDSSCESNAFKEHIERVTTMYTTTTHTYCR